MHCLMENGHFRSACLDIHISILIFPCCEFHHFGVAFSLLFMSPVADVAASADVASLPFYWSFVVVMVRVIALIPIRIAVVVFVFVGF